MIKYIIKFDGGCYADGGFDRCLPPNPYVTEDTDEACMWDKEEDCHYWASLFDRPKESYDVVAVNYNSKADKAVKV